ncbi:hypothetical protein ABID56_000898 [Alkalibacillus flavidus]|uniref:Spo0E like sporulation regulatory protein n=1 Tax=Alkalibacillus flavidus TaxID=546021 RepID=A0ABV2KT96_9BACI
MKPLTLEELRRQRKKNLELYGDTIKEFEQEVKKILDIMKVDCVLETQLKLRF